MQGNGRDAAVESHGVDEVVLHGVHEDDLARGLGHVVSRGEVVDEELACVALDALLYVVG